MQRAGSSSVHSCSRFSRLLLRKLITHRKTRSANVQINAAQHSDRTGPQQVITADSDKDGHKNIAVASSVASKDQIFVNSQDGGFKTRTTIITAADSAVLRSDNTFARQQRQDPPGNVSEAGTVYESGHLRRLSDCGRCAADVSHKRIYERKAGPGVEVQSGAAQFAKSKKLHFAINWASRNKQSSLPDDSKKLKRGNPDVCLSNDDSSQNYISHQEKSRMTRRQTCFSFLLLCFQLAGLCAYAQITNVTGPQTQPIPGAGHDYIHMLNETVNPANGALSIRIGIPIPPGRGLSVPFSFGYDSNAAHHLAAPQSPGPADNQSYLAQGGWSYSIAQLNMIQKDNSWSTLSPVQHYDCYYLTDYMLTDLGGQAHPINISPIESLTLPTCAGIGNPPVTGVRPDEHLSGTGDGFQAVTSTYVGGSPLHPPPVAAADPDGTVYYFSNSATRSHFIVNTSGWSGLPDWIEDRNGNMVTFTDNGGGSFSVTDTLDRPVLSSSGFGSTGNTITISGISNPYTITWGTAGSNWSFATQITHDGGDGVCPGFTGHYQVTLPEITSIKLPNGESYTFQYDATSGLLSKITYPTGGYVRYVWGTYPLSDYITYNDTNHTNTCHAKHDTQAIVDRYVSFDGTTEVLHQHFAYAPTTWVPDNVFPTGQKWTNKSTTVITYDLRRGTNFNTVYNYVPIGGPVQPNDPIIYSTNTIPLESTIAYYDTSGSLLQTVTKTFVGGITLPPDVKTTLGNTGPVSQTTHVYAGYLLTDQYAYDFGTSAPGNLLKHTHIDYASFGSTPIYPSAPSILDRPRDVITSDGGGHRVAETDYGYDQTGLGAASATGHDDPNYPTSYVTRGNATTKTVQCLGCTNTTTTYTYDQTGQVLSVTDPCGNAACTDMTGTSHTTSYSYTDKYAAGSGTPPASTDAYVTTITYPTVNGVTQHRYFQYAYADGQLTQQKDDNQNTAGVATNYLYADSLRRLTETDYADGGKTTIGYNDSVPSVTTGRLISSGVTESTITVMDGMGHPTRTELTSDPVGTDYVDTQYDGMGNVYTVSNSYRTTSDPTYGLTTYTYDSLNRKTKQFDADGVGIETWSYPGQSVIFTDEDENEWQRTSDGLGRLIEVLEPGSSKTPTIETDYGYNALDDLMSVNQKGAPSGSLIRSFSYDSLSRLTSASNPENGTVRYSYDNNSNVATKTDARGISVTYGYDALNRVTGKTYSDGTPTVTFAYDKPDAAIASYALSNFVGRLGGAYLTESGVALHSYLPAGYDAVGRPYGYIECPGSSSCATSNNGYAVGSYATFYDLVGDVMESASGVVHTMAATTAGDFAAGTLNTYDAADRLNSVVGETATFTAPGQDSASTMSLFSATSTNPSAPAYGPMGGLMNAQLPSNSTTQTNPINISRTYDKRGRVLTETDLGGSSQSTVYKYALGYDLVGNVTSYNDFVMGTWSAGYSANKLTSASSSAGLYSSINFTWTYDNLGNRRTQTPSGTGQYPVPTAQTLTYNGNNQISGLHYDLAGNMIDDGTSQYLYDGEGRLCAVYHYQVPISMTGYIYDAMGNRIGKGTISTFSCNALTDGFSLSNEYIHGLDGKQLVETSGWFSVLHSNFFANGQLLATNNGSNWYYNLNDWLGSKRVIANMTGTISTEYASLPYGDGQTTVNYYGSDDTENHFTGKERDPESGNDYFGARYYTSNMGRFLSPDWSAKVEPIPYSKLDNPQSLNLYAYVQNNPLSSVDDDGHFQLCNSPLAGSPTPCAGSSDTQANLSDQQPWWQKGKHQIASSDGTGFWKGLGQRFNNWLHNDGFKTNEELDREFGYSTSTILYSRVDLSGSAFSAVDDQVGLTGALLGSGTLTAASSLASVVHDPSPLNVSLNGLSTTIPLAIPGADVPIAVGFAGYSGSKFAADTLTNVFTPDASQSDTTVENGIIVQDPQAAFDSQ